MCDRYFCILPDINLKSHHKRRKKKNIKIIVVRTLDLFVQVGINIQNRTSKTSFPLTTLTSTKAYRQNAHSAPQRFAAKRHANLGPPSWGFSSKNHVQTAREFHDLNMDLIVLNTAFVHLTMASKSYAHRYLCKNVTNVVRAKERVWWRRV